MTGYQGVAMQLLGCSGWLLTGQGNKAHPQVSKLLRSLDMGPFYNVSLWDFFAQQAKNINLFALKSNSTPFLNKPKEFEI